MLDGACDLRLVPASYCSHRSVTFLTCSSDTLYAGTDCWAKVQLVDPELNSKDTTFYERWSCAENGESSVPFLSEQLNEADYNGSCTCMHVAFQSSLHF